LAFILAISRLFRNAHGCSEMLIFAQNLIALCDQKATSFLIEFELDL